jgi:hypothetical protein
MLLLAVISAMSHAQQTLAQSAPSTDDNSWLMELSTMNFPREFAHGKLHNLPFKVQKADFDGQFLHLVEGEDWISGKLCLAIAINEKQIEGKDFIVSPADSEVPKKITTVNKIWENKDGTHTTRALTSGYAMRLHFGKLENGLIPTYVLIRIDDTGRKERDYVAGFCNVTLTNKP